MQRFFKTLGLAGFHALLMALILSLPAWVLYDVLSYLWVLPKLQWYVPSAIATLFVWAVMGVRTLYCVGRYYSERLNKDFDMWLL